MRVLFSLIFMSWWLAGISQQPLAAMPIDTTKASQEYWKKWTTDLFEMGVEKKNDSVIVREEVIRLVKDSVYRNSVYPKNYSWLAVVDILKKMELKKAFWHLINVYMTDTTTASRSKVLGTIMLYDSLIDMNNMLLNAFYTYSFADPRVCQIIKGKPEIYRPDLLENHLLVTKEIIRNIYYYRKEKSKQQNQ